MAAKGIKLPKQLLTILSDGRPLKEGTIYFNELLEFLKSNGLLSNNGRGSIDFCGMIQIRDHLFLFLPKTLETRERSINISRFRLVLKVLRKFSKGKSDAEKAGEFGIFGDSASFELAWKILDDWENYGCYEPKKLHTSLRESGRIHWAKTLRSAEPVFDIGGPIYPEPYRTSVSADEDNYVRSLHKTIAAICYHRFGWLRGRIIEELENPDLYKRRYQADQALKKLNIEKSKTHSDRNLYLFGLLEKLIKNVGELQTETKTAFGLRDFWRVWEEICEQVLGNDYQQVRELIPRPKYILEGEHKYSDVFRALEFSKKPERPDIVLVSKDVVAVLDAKYYDTNQNMPNWSDLVKQFLYASTLKSALKQQNVLNVLVFPAERTILPEPNRNVPFAGLHSQGKLLPEFGRIHCVCCNLEDFMRKYLFGVFDLELRQRILGLVELEKSSK